MLGIFLSVVAANVCMVSLYFICITLYNLFFHPLKSFPGPKLWAASRIPLIRCTLSGRQPQVLLALHEQYGDSVRISPNEISYTNAGAWKDVYANRQGHQEFDKYPYAMPRTVNGVPSILGATRENHTRYRRLLSHAFSDKGLREQEPRIRQYVDLLIQRLHEHAGEGPQNMVNWYNWTTFDLIGDLAFGEPFHCLEQVYTHPWIAFVYGNISSIPYINTFREYGLFPIMQFFVPKHLLRARQENYEYAKDKVTRRMKLGEDRGDFMDHVVKYEYPKGMTLEELTSSSGTLVLAGSETTATLLSGATYHLLRNPGVMDKLVSEIRGTFASGEHIDIVSVSQIKYLTAVLDESLRIYPPVPRAVQRVVPKGGDTVLGKWLPGGTIIAVQHYASYHSSSNFHAPNDFIPERFLPDEADSGRPNPFTNDNRAVLQPFALGPRNCIGRNLAYVEMRLILAKVLWHFDLKLDQRVGEWADQQAPVLWEKTPLLINLTPVSKTSY